MDHKNAIQTQKYKRRNKIRSRLQKVVMVLACVVVFCTVYALILPAVTSGTNTFCGLEEHLHTIDCYEQVTVGEKLLVCNEDTLGLHKHGPECWDADHRIICGQADYVAHTHNELCYDAEGALLCTLPERSTHVHADACYALKQVAPEQTEAEITEAPGETAAPPVETTGHTHEEGCYAPVQGELLCQLPEEEGHVHTEECYVPGETLICTVTEVLALLLNRQRISDFSDGLKGTLVVPVVLSVFLLLAV
ncbi:MAG: hypothetical protein IKM59_07445, partial [Oscillospiraceae bacterium]|nr:hypothetical protein [Oscillospiraceae bacterium]